MSVSRTYESSRNLLTQVKNMGTNLVSQFDYSNDAVGRRTARLDSTSRPSVQTNMFGYNSKSELTTAAMDTNDYGYAYDPIGNRTDYTNICTANGGSTNVLTYLANALNQYTNIHNGVVVEPTYDLDGNMLLLHSLGGGATPTNLRALLGLREPAHRRVERERRREIRLRFHVAALPESCQWRDE